VISPRDSISMLSIDDRRTFFSRTLLWVAIFQAAGALATEAVNWEK
jgi:hypothetical protein